MPNLPTGTVTFLFTDIEGSTRLSQEYPDTWEGLRLRHHAILQAAIDANSGYTFQVIGDAFCAAFATAEDALRAAGQVQLDLHAEDWGVAPVRVRIGIHTGKAEIQEKGDYTGYTVLSRVQRLMSAGHGGQTLISRTTQNLLQGDLPAGVVLQDMGERKLKDLIQPEHIYQVNFPNLQVEFPALKTLDAQLNNLPAQMTPFVGRDREIRAILALLRNPAVRLVTLTGPGGTGKTRLSIQVAAELLDEYEHGVWFVELDSITNPDLVLPVVAATLKVKELAGVSIEQALHDYLARQNLLLVIDNFEQVVSAAAAIGRLLAAAPQVKVCVSSREVLHLRAEHNYPVPPLGLPESRQNHTATVIAQYEAVALFLQHARAANPNFEINEENASSLAEICIRLDGLPLAIELAAARSRMFKPAIMLEKLKNSLGLLAGGSRDLPLRQQTIRNVIEWSYNLLENDEKALFVRLGIFKGGWTAEAADAVCGQGLSIDVITGLEALLDKSLIRQIDGRSTEPRFTMLETVREYAFEKLTLGQELSIIQNSHADYFELRLQKTFDALNGPGEASFFAQLDDDLDNLRSAVEWSLAHQRTSLVFKAGRLYQYWNQRTNYREPLGWLERSFKIDTESSTLDRARAFNAAGNLSIELEEDEPGRKYYESAIQLFRDCNDLNGIVSCLNNLGNIAWREKNYEKARQLYEQCLEDGNQPESWGHAMVLNNLGSLARIRGDWQVSRDYYMYSRKICEKMGAEAGVSFADWFLGLLALAQRNLDEARGHFLNELNAGWIQSNPIVFRMIKGYLGYIDLLTGKKEEARPILNEAAQAAREYIKQIPNSSMLWLIMDGIARLELSDGHFERAAQLFGAAWILREQGSFFLSDAERPDYENCIAEICNKLGKSDFDNLFAHGQEMSLRDAIGLALEE